MAGSEPAKKVRPNKEREAEERRLIEAAQSDPARFADVYETYLELVYAYVARRVRNRDEAEDLTAEVFRKALAGLPRFKWRGAPFAAWLFRIASNTIADRAKRVAKEVPLDESGATEQGGTRAQARALIRFNKHNWKTASSERYCSDWLMNWPKISTAF